MGILGWGVFRTRIAKVPYSWAVEFRVAIKPPRLPRD